MVVIFLFGDFFFFTSLFIPWVWRRASGPPVGKAGFHSPSDSQPASPHLLDLPSHLEGSDSHGLACVSGMSDTSFFNARLGLDENLPSSFLLKKQKRNSKKQPMMKERRCTRSSHSSTAHSWLCSHYPAGWFKWLRMIKMQKSFKT